jgi:cytochrome-b5 reductase
MDWIRKMGNTPNISGTDGKFLNVTEEELAKHNKKTDCWIAISGKRKTKFCLRETFFSL